MWCIQKLNKYLTLMVLVVLLAPLQRVYAGSVTLGMELAYEKNRHKELAPVKSEGFRNSFKQNYLFFNSGSVVHRKILPYSAKFSYNKDNITNFDSSQKVVSKAFNFNSTILPVFRFPVTVSYRRTDRTTNILGGNRNQSQRVGLRWNLGFQKLPKTALFFNYREADEHGRKRDSSDYGFSLSKQAGGDVKYGRTTYFFAYRGKSSGRSRAVNDASSKAGQLTNSVSLSSATFFSKRSNFKQSLEYEIRESVRQENDEAFGPGNGSGSKVIRYSGGLGLETNPYLSQNYGFGYSFDSGPGRADALSTVFSGRIDKVVSNRLNLESSGQYSRDSTFLIRGGQVRSEGGRISTGARWKISQQLVSSYTLFARTAKTVSNEVGVDRESKAFGARTGVNFSDTFRFFTLRGGLTGSLSNDETDSTRSKVLSSQANTAVSSQALKIVSLSGNYSITNGKSSDLQQGNDIGSVSVTNVTRSESYGVSVSNIKYNKIVSL
ncbi:MAG: hypothetical protein ACE5FU_10790, partial [Nitrospinota bacterium]